MRSHNFAQQRRLAFESLETRRLLAIDVTNLGLEAYGLADAFQLEGDLLAVEASEFSQQIDLNSDGDLDDVVMQVFDTRSAATTNLGLAERTTLSGGTAEYSIEGDVLAMLVSEQAQGYSDLNGDGDASRFDRVLHLYDARTHTTTNLGVAASGLQFSGNVLTLGVREFSQGNTDLNGDGDASDFTVLHVYNARARIAMNIGFAGLFFHLDGAGLAFQAIESLQGNTDLNNDGDSNDLVMHFADLSALLPNPIALIDRLKVNIQDLNLQSGITQSLTAKLDAALMNLRNRDASEQQAAIGTLQALTHEVTAQRGKALLAEDADKLLADALEIIGLIREQMLEDGTGS